MNSLTNCETYPLPKGDTSAYFNYETTHFSSSCYYSSIDDIREVMRQYSKLTHHIFKESHDTRKEYYLMRDFRCTRNNSKASSAIYNERGGTDSQCGCKFNIKFYMEKKDQTWNVDPTMCLIHNHPPLGSLAYEKKSKNHLTDQQKHKLEVLLWKNLLLPHQTTFQDIKDAMNEEFPDHGELSMNKIKYEAGKVKQRYISKAKHKKSFDLEEYVACAIVKYEKAYFPLHLGISVHRCVNLSSTLALPDSLEFYTHQVLNQEFTPVHYKTIHFDDISMNFEGSLESIIKV